MVMVLGVRIAGVLSVVGIGRGWDFDVNHGVILMIEVMLMVRVRIAVARGRVQVVPKEMGNGGE